MNPLLTPLSQLLVFTGINALWQTTHASNKRALILAYHRVLEENAPLVDQTQGDPTPAQMRHQLERVLRDRRPVSLLELVQKQLWHEPVFAVTFDDGYGDNLRVALPLLQEYQITATVFLTTGAMTGKSWMWWDKLTALLEESFGKELTFMGKRYSINKNNQKQIQSEIAALLKLQPHRDAMLEDLSRELNIPETPPAGLYLNWDEVRTLIKAGWMMGGHTINHPILTTIKPDEAKHEIESCADDIERETGQRPLFFAYPEGLTGTYDDRHMKMVSECGYAAAFLADGGVIADAMPLYAIPRLSPRSHESRATFELRLSGLYYALKGKR